jgi:pimeloyl-ACP methyl ester carboxylesterase
MRGLRIDHRSSDRGASAGSYSSGLPFNRFGNGRGRVIVLQGMQFENRSLSGLPLRFLRRLYRALEADYTIDVVGRRPDLPEGCTLRDMSNDYATMMREELQGPVDLIGLSTGGLIAQHLAAEHPDLVRRLILHSSAYRLSDEAKQLQVRVGELAREHRWREAYAALLAFMSPRRGGGVAVRLVAPFGGLLFGRPTDHSDLLVTYEASNEHDFKDRLAEIKAPTLVVAGDRDPFYTPALFRETAEGIPKARLILYEGVGHPASGKRFTQDLLLFLKEGAGSDSSKP